MHLIGLVIFFAYGCVLFFSTSLSTKLLRPCLLTYQTREFLQLKLVVLGINNKKILPPIGNNCREFSTNFVLS
jgi:hypothetical protein